MYKVRATSGENQGASPLPGTAMDQAIVCFKSSNGILTLYLPMEGSYPDS